MPPFGHLFDFNDIFRNELSVINERRKQHGPAREPIVLKEDKADSTGVPVLTPNENASLVGLALSGGGVRSAAFCLGSLQALNEAGVLKPVDYLSTVSGGGYTGCSLSAGLESIGGVFPFESRIVEDETPAMQHIRDYSNYLFPNGAKDWLDNVSIYVRGLVANFVLIMPFLLAAAAATIWWNPTPDDLHFANVLGHRVINIFPFEHFVITIYLILVLLVIAALWSLLRSTRQYQNRHEVPSWSTTAVGVVAL